MRKLFLRIGSLLALIAVGLGALGSHALKDVLTPEALDTFETGVRYHFFHALAILLVDVLIHFRKKAQLVWAGWMFTLGVVLFSGSLYLLALREAMNLPVEWLGPVTPVGGLLFMAGWALLFLSTFTFKSPKKKEDT